MDVESTDWLATESNAMPEADLTSEINLNALSGPESEGVQFLTTIFGPQDLVLYRPIETWTERDRKQNNVIYKEVLYRAAHPLLCALVMQRMLAVGTETCANIFFGVCPRFGNKGRFDLAWQIRKVNVLWADVDHVTVEEALARVDEAGLPKPSIVVNSGYGAHIYWLLDTAYLIDDVGDPPPVETEWTKMPDGRKRPRKFFVDDGEKVFLDQRRHASRLSPKAEQFQDILAGIAKAVGGDHTKDLSRLLRIPGTLNRKDQRNGREPVLAALIKCEPKKRYPLATFEPFASPAPETERARQIVAMPLPRPRKISTSKADKLAELIAASSIAPAGSRSEADFAVCCYAIRHGISREEVWSQVEQVGKFADGGRRYFDHTWINAEYDVRARTYDKLQRAEAKRAAVPMMSAGDGDPEPPSDGPGGDRDGGRELPTIHVDPASTPVSHTMRQITDRLLAAGDCYLRTDQLVVLKDQTIWTVLSAAELAGLLNNHVEFYFIDEEGGEFKPLPASYGNTWLKHPGERVRLPMIKLYSHNPVYTDDWRLVTPGYDDPSGIYYAGPAVEGREGTVHLDKLLADFCFKAPSDRTNYVGTLLTALLVPRFIGSKPAVLFNGNQPELGKSILAQIIAILRDGSPVETASYNPNDEEFEKRLASIVRRGGTTIIIDNAKGRSRNPKIESACLERSITDPILSFRLLGFSQDIRAENSHIFCITANSPDVSRDLVTRSVVVNLFYEGDPKRRTFSITDPEGYAQERRLELLGELIGMVERWKAAGIPMATVHSRFNKRGWGNIIGGILAVAGEPDFLANAEEAATQLDDTRREFSELVSVMADHPQGIWTAAELKDLANKHDLLKLELGEGSARSQATRMGFITGRYVCERFELGGERSAVFHRSENNKGKLYRVQIIESGAELANV